MELLDQIGFRVSKNEALLIISDEYGEFSENDKVSFKIYISVIDILKREKLILSSLLHTLNYMIFVILIILMFLYISYFYN